MKIRILCALLILGMFGCSERKKEKVECTPQSMGLLNSRQQESKTFNSIKSGLWSDTATWSNNEIPDSESYVIINNEVELDSTLTVNGLAVTENSILKFSKSKSVTLSSRGNIVILGKLVMRPDSFSITQTIKFIDVKEKEFVGGGMDIFTTDIGLWVRESGSVDLSGTYKTPWTCLGGGVNKGSKTISCIRPPTGWQVGDEISIAPTTPTSVSTFVTGFDLRKIKSINGQIITLDSALSFDHPKVVNPLNSNQSFNAEVLNLTRNVRIEGTGDGNVSPSSNGRAHINIGMVTAMSNIENIQIRYMAPRQQNTDDAYTSSVTGRYALHFHHCNEALRGMIVSGVVARDCGGHAFVPHDSHGITFFNDISYNTFDDAYWWDVPTSQSDTINNSNDVTYDSCVSALLKADPAFRGYRLANFLLGSGFRNTVKNSVAIGNNGNLNSAGFLWPESSNYTPNTWEFDSNLTHNCKADGIFVWENDSSNHIVNNFTAYRNGMNGVEQGAYSNGYKYNNINLFNNKGQGVYLHANPIRTGTADMDGYYMAFNKVYSTEPLYIAPHTLLGRGPTLFKDCIFPSVTVSELPRRMNYPPSGLFDFVNCNLEPINFNIIGIEEGSLIRVQRADGTAFKINDRKIVSDIPPFIKK